MITTLDVLLGGRSFVVAFATEEDARRFITFLGEHERECNGLPANEPVYRLDPQWSLGQYHHRPLYAAWGLERRPVLRMILELVEARLGSYERTKEEPILDMRPTKEKGTTFSLARMPPAPLLN